MAEMKPMKLNIAYPPNGTQKLLELETDEEYRPFIDKRISQEVSGDSLGKIWKGYTFRITGGNDKEGFPMKQGILTNGRVRLLLNKNSGCYRPKRSGERRKKSVRGCIVDKNLSVLNLIVVKRGEKEIPGLTDREIPNRLGPKRVGKIRKLYNLSRNDDVRKYVLKRPLPLKPGKKQRFKAPKIQRLITPVRLRRKRHLKSIKKVRIQKGKEQAAAYQKLLLQRAKEARTRRASSIQKRRASSTRS
ncbi:40S ribosomal protein S6 [Oopsacas minuta]|uniref:40S ribosomal protein S6 n=1 Tax=Oopsacas minuta TaxID=111878 RepID=A0AAV7JCP0_9METZ|nr:40S ribosomal protein S6 [Oopsacas minuta]